MFKSKYFLIILLMIFGTSWYRAEDYLNDNNNLQVSYHETDNQKLNENNTIIIKELNLENNQNYYHYKPLTQVGYEVYTDNKPLRILFNGTTQSNYINPYKEQYIFIEEPINVTSIEHRLVDPTKKLIFNYGVSNTSNVLITASENSGDMLFDFKDITFINKIGSIADFTKIEVIDYISFVVEMFNSVFEFIIDVVFSIIDTLAQPFELGFWEKLWDNIKQSNISKGISNIWDFW